MENFENEKKVKKSKGGLILLFTLVIVCLAILGYYFFKTNNPRYIFESQIKDILSSDVEETNFKTAKVTTNITANINSSDEELKKISDIINDAKLTMISEVDTENEDAYVGLNLTKASDNLIDAKIKVEEESKKMYVNLGELFDKVIELDLSDVIKEDEEISDTNISSLGQMVDSIKAQKIAKEEIKKQLKDEYFSKENVNIDGKNLTRNEMKVSEKEFVNVVKSVLSDLSENDEFLSCYKDKEDVKKAFKETIEKIDDSELDDNSFIIIDIYTSGIMKKVKRIDLSLDEKNNKISIQITQIDENTYSYKIIKDDEMIAEGKLSIKNGKNDYNLQISVKYEENEYVFNIDGNVVYDEKIDTIDTENSVNINDLSMEEMFQIIDNFSQSKLYEIVESVSGSESYNSVLELDDSDVY